MVNYIFANFQESSDEMKNIRNTLQRQVKYNKSIATFTLAVTTYIILMEIHNYRQDKKIIELNREVKELKRVKGE